MTVDPTTIQLCLVIYAETKGVPRDVAWAVAESLTRPGATLPASPVHLLDEMDRAIRDHAS